MNMLIQVVRRLIFRNDYRKMTVQEWLERMRQLKIGTRE